jgi:hypothetical protein
MAKDPVCGMFVEERTATITRTVHEILDWLNEQDTIKCPEGLSPKSSAGTP